MKKTILTAVVVTAITGIATVQAQASDYEVKSGDTLWAIAKENGTSVSELKELNELTSDLIIAGDKIKVESKDFYVIKTGDTLKETAEKFDVSTAELMRWNDLSSTELKAGKKIIVSEEGFHKAKSAVKPAVAATPMKPVEQRTSNVVKAENRLERIDAPAASDNRREVPETTTNEAATLVTQTSTAAASRDNRPTAETKTAAPVSGNVASVANSIAGGKTYVYGANSGSAVDCSAFAQQVLASMGKSIPRTTYAQMAAGTPVSTPQAGDLVFFNGGSHVGVYIGNGQMVDALNPSEGIKQRAVSYISGSVTGYYRY